MSLHTDGRAAPGDRSWRVASVFAFAGTVVAVFGLFASRGLFSPAPAAIALQVLAGTLAVWARLTFGLRSFHAAANPTAGGLVTNGPYRFVRHLIYAAILLFVWSGALASPSAIHLALASAATAATAVRIVCEEHLLLGTYPEYAAYARRTRRMVVS